MKHQNQAPSEVTVFRPNQAGELEAVAKVQAQPRKTEWSEYEGETTYRRLILTAIQETGEEMFVSFADGKAEAEHLKSKWLREHPEHRDVLIETYQRGI